MSICGKNKSKYSKYMEVVIMHNLEKLKCEKRRKTIENKERTYKNKEEMI